MMNAKLKGFDDLARKLSRMAHAIKPRDEQAILREGAIPLLNEMQILAPVLSGELRDSLAIVDVEGGVAVGPTGDQVAVGRYNELGTVNMAAQPFIIPAFDNVQGESVGEIKAGLTVRIDRARGA